MFYELLKTHKTRSNLTAELHLSIHCDDFNFERFWLFLLQSKDRHFDCVLRLENCGEKEICLGGIHKSYLITELQHI